MTDEDAIDILKNCIADYVIGDYCTGKHCIDENMCKYEDCPFNTAIDTVTELIEKQQKVIDEMAKKIYEEGIVWDNKEDVKEYFKKQVETEEK